MGSVKLHSLSFISVPLFIICTLLMLPASVFSLQIQLSILWPTFFTQFFHPLYFGGSLSQTHNAQPVVLEHTNLNHRLHNSFQLSVRTHTQHDIVGIHLSWTGCSHPPILIVITLLTQSTTIGLNSTCMDKKRNNGLLP